MKRTWVACLAAGLIAITGLLIANAVNSGNGCMATEKTLKVAQREPIYIDGNENFNATNGVTSGNGTTDNPFIIENWTINASTANGIDIRNTDKYFIIRNCTIHNGNGNYNGIIFYNNVKNGKIDNVTSYNNYGGIYLCYSSNNDITNCTVYNNYEGITQVTSTNNKITNCTVHNNYFGIYLEFYSDNNQITNCGVYNNTYGIYLYSSSNNNQITSCNVYNNSYGISVNSSLNNQIINCAIYNNSYGIRTSSANNTSIESCTVLNSTNVGVDISYRTTYIVNSTISDSTNYDIYLNGSTLYLLNTTLINVSFADINSTLICSWYLDVNVIDIYNNTIPYANVRVKDAHNNYIGDFSTGMSGVAQDIPCVAYIQNSTTKDYSMNNHTIIVGNNTQSLNMSENKEIIMPVSYFSIASPVTITLSYENYLVVQENNLIISENGNLTLSHVTLKMNCSVNGEYHIEVQSGGEMYILNNSNISSANEFHYLFWVRNEGKFEMRDSALSECGIGLWEIHGSNSGLWINTDNAIIYNSSFSSCVDGIITYQVKNFWISHCSFSNNNVGVHLLQSTNISVKKCNFLNNTYGTVIDSSSDITVIDCDYISNGNTLYSKDWNRLSINVTVLDPAAINCCGSSGIEIIDCILSENNYGICLRDSSDNTISNCNISFNKGGIYCNNLSPPIVGNNITSCSIYNNSEFGIYLSSSSNNKVSACDIYNNHHGICLDTSSTSNYIINSTVTNSSNYDFYLAQNSQLTSLNTTFNKTKVYFADLNSTFTVSWYLHINVLWNNSIPAEEANVTVYDKFSNKIVIDNSTDETGWLRYVIVQEYTQNQTGEAGKIYFTPYNVNASQGAFWNLTSIPITNTMECTLYLNQPYIHNAPKITDTSPDLEYSINENVTPEFKFNISHPNNLTLTYHWYLDDIEVKNGTLENTSTVQWLNFTYPFNYTSSGEHKIKITISDGNATVSRTWSLTVININAPPTIIVFSPSWSCMSITEEQNVSFSVTAVDVDGDALSYWWYVYYENNSVPVKEYGGVNATNTIIFGPFDATGNYTVEIKVNETYNQSSIATHTWLLKVWNITELNLQFQQLLEQLNELNNTVSNLISDIANLTNTTNFLLDKWAELNATISNLTSQISNLTQERDKAIEDKLAAENRTAQAEKERDEERNARLFAEYKLAASVVGAAIAGVFAGAFVFSLLLKKRKGSK